MAERIYVGTKPHHRDVAGEKIRKRISGDLGIGTIRNIRVVSVYILNGQFTARELAALAQGPFCDPIIQDYTINSTFISGFDWLIEVGFHPGVTDNVGRTAREAVAVTLHRTLAENETVHTASQYFIEGNISAKHVERIARQMLANELIQTVHIYKRDEWIEVHASSFPAPLVTGHEITEFYREVNLEAGDEELVRISKQGMLALSLDEMKTIQAHFRDPRVRETRARTGMPVNPTNAELEILAQTWSEHCKHKIFNAQVTYYEDDRHPQTVSSVFKVYIRQATDMVRRARGEADICLSVFRDNAGVITFDDDNAIVFKVETHNSPSALDPYGGALTGIVGVNRDPFGTGLGSRLIANTDVFCFASPFYARKIPPRILHPKRVFEGVREGVEHGGNKSGIPTVNGTVVFDDRYLGKPLVYCGTLGIMPRTINGRNGYEKKALAGDRIIMTGGRIGKDGIHGATFSSEPLHEGSPATAVQIGDPITQKRMTDFLLKARDAGLYNAITDDGAGGLSSSIGEMAQDTGGALVDLRKAPLKYHGLEPWEIFLSEAQERMTIAVRPGKVQAFMELAREWNVEATDLGEFTDSGFLTVKYGDTTVADISMNFLHDGLPQMRLTARWRTPAARACAPVRTDDTGKDLLNLLKRLNICSKEYIVRQYDHEVQGGSVVKPLCGAKNDGPSDAAVLRPRLDSFQGIVVSNGIVPRYSDIDTYAMASCAVDEAVRNAVAAGADPDHMAALDNFCWCDPIPSGDNPDGEHKLAQLIRACQAVYDLCVNYQVPLISGKDSMKNDYHIGDTRISIPPTLLISVVARIPDVRMAVTMDFKAAGNQVYLVGETRRELGASEYALMRGLEESTVPLVHKPKRSYLLYKVLHGLIQEGKVRACHDLSDGGLAVALAEMCFSGDMGASIDLRAMVQSGCTTDAELLFSESQSRFLLEVTKENSGAVENSLAGFDIARIGETVRGERIAARGLSGAIVLDVSRIDAKAAWKSALAF
jgi:phosphoribosylformylglycinamidine synthase